MAISTVTLTLALYLVHFFVSKVMFHFSKKDAREAFEKFGTELAFMGISFFGVAILDGKSQFYQDYSNLPLPIYTQDVLYTFLLFLGIDLGSVYLYRLYKKEKNNSPQAMLVVLLFVVSHMLGLLSVLIGFSLI